MEEKKLNVKDLRPVIRKKQYDVIVAGGGIAGVAAAVSSARSGASTLLIEKQINLGGLATTGLINWYEPLCDGRGVKMIGGIAEELIKLSIRYGFENLPLKWGGEGKNPSHYDRYATRFSPTVFSLALDDFVRDSGADIKFDALATFPIIDENVIKGIVCETVDGKELYTAKCVVDATGDASVCKRSGMPTELGENWLVYVCHATDEKAVLKYNNTHDIAALRSWLSCGGDRCGGGNIDGVPVQKMESSDSENDFIIFGKKYLFEKYKNGDKNSKDILSLPDMPQYRKIRRIIGEYEFTGDEGMTFEDSIGCTGDFRYPDKRYQLPFRTLYNKEFPNLLAAGRIISASGDGWEITRVIPVCAMTGQAAGTAAAMIAHGKGGFDSIIEELQGRLANDGVIIGF